MTILSDKEKIAIYKNLSNKKYMVVACQDLIDKSFKELIGEPLFGDSDRLTSRELQILSDVLDLLISKIQSNGENGN